MREVIGQDAGQGGAGTVSDEMLSALKEEARRIADRDQRGVVSAREAAQDARFCVWAGQSEDSRKHADDRNGEAPLPFEGACDQRVPYADMVVNEKVALVVLASLRAYIGVVPVEGTDAARAAKVEVLRQWLIRGMGSSYMRELIRLGNLVFGGEPGAGLLNLEWQRVEALRMVTVTPQELGRRYVLEASRAAGVAVDAEPSTPAAPAAAAGGIRDGGEAEAAGGGGVLADIERAGMELVAAFEGKAFDQEALAGMVQAFFPRLTLARARRVAGELLQKGSAEFPEPVVVREGPVARAEEINRDVYLPSNTGEFQRARMFFRVMWLSRPEVLARAQREEWSEEFVEGLLGTDGKNGLEGQGSFREFVLDADGGMKQATADDYAGLFEVVYGYFEAANVDGIPGKYVLPFSMALDVAACERRLVEFPRGEWPGVMFQREVVTDRLMESRGLSRLAAPFQGMLKLNLDTMGDHAQLSIPPVLGKGMGDQGRLYIEPLGYVPVPRTGELEFMKMPEYSRAADTMLKVLWRQGNEYFGRQVDEVPQWIKLLQDEFTVAQWLTYLGDWHRQLIGLALQEMTEEQLRRVTNWNGEVAGLSREDVAGEYDVQVVFEARYLDPDYVEKLAGIIGRTVLPMDASKTIETAPMVQGFLWALMPGMAQASLRSVERAAEDEARQEFDEYLKILGGVEPERVTDGSQNYGVRLGMYRTMQERNPQVFESLPEDRQAILRARLEFLAAQTEQFGANRQIGREGARRSLN